jgi:hypothetical protein
MFYLMKTCAVAISRTDTCDHCRRPCSMQPSKNEIEMINAVNREEVHRQYGFKSARLPDDSIRNTSDAS